MKTSHSLACRVLPAALLLVSSLPLQAASWIGGGVNNNWSTFSNWDSGASPFFTPVTFGDPGKTLRSGTSSVITTSGTISALHYRNYGTGASDWQVTQINAGVTLTINGSSTNDLLSVGGVAYNNPAQTTRVAIIGEGSLVINKAAGTFRVVNGGDANGIGFAELDLSDLANFTATVANFNIGAEGYAQGVLKLAATNTITATDFRIARTGARGNVPPSNPSSVYLGKTNTFNIGNIYVGAEDFGSSNPQKGTGTLEFLDKTNGSTIVIRGASGGTSRSNMAVGYSAAGSATGASALGSADFRGGSIDARFDTLFIGSGHNNGTDRTMTGTFSMDAGTVDAVNVSLGRSVTGGIAAAGYVTGNLDIEGGTFKAQSLNMAANESGSQKVAGNLNISGGTVEITGGITMGSVGTGNATAVEATINLTGGSLTVGGDIAKGGIQSTITSKINVRGGTLDVGGKNVNVSELNFESGSIKNLGQFNAGAALVKSSTGTAILSGTNAYTGATTVFAGSLLVNGLLENTSAIAVQNGATLGGSGTINAAATVTVQSGGRLAPGNSPGTLRVGSLDLQEGSTFSLELNGSEAGSGYDQVIASGGILLNGANLVLSLGFAPVDDAVFTLLKNEGILEIGGAFATVNGIALSPDNRFELSFDSVTYRFQLSYTGNGTSLVGGNDLVIQALAVPEPGISAVVIAGGILAGAYRLRRKAR